MILRPSLDYSLYEVEFVSPDVDPALRFNVVSVDVESAIAEVRDYSVLPFVLYFCGTLKHGSLRVDKLLKSPLVCAVATSDEIYMKGGF